MVWPNVMARPTLSAAGAGSASANTWSKAGAHPAAPLETSPLCAKRRAANSVAALQSTACPTTYASRRWRRQLGGAAAHGEPAPRRTVGQRLRVGVPAPSTSTARRRALAAAALQFRIRCTLAARGHAQGDARSMVRSWVRGIRSGDGANQRGIATKGEALGRCAVHHEVEASAV